MLNVEIVLRNYRCFRDQPAHFRIRDGFTALVGVNNSGKSSLLRMPYEIRPLLGQLAGPTNAGLQLLRGNSSQGTWFPSLPAGERVFRTGTDRPIELELIVRDGPKGQFVSAGGEQLVLAVTFDRQGNTSTILRTEGGSVLAAPGTPLDQSAPTLDLNPITSVMQVLLNAMYVGPFRNAINVGAQSAYYDIQTGDAFVAQFAEYKSGASYEANEAVGRLVDEIRGIFGFRRLEISPAVGNTTLQLMIDDRSYRLAEQGAGLAHFVVVLVNVLIRRPSFLLIDEPELNLHASLQLDFLQTLARYTQYGVVFATHSLGLARTAADRIYTLRKPVGGTSTMRPYEGDTELVTLLGQLSFDRRPDLGFSKVLLVEGKTELRTLMQFLRFYGKEHEVLMLPLHGDEMIGGDVRQELSELLRIGGDVHYLIDSERNASGEPLKKRRQGFVDLCAELGIGGHVLERRALENYLTDDAVKRVFGDSVSALGPYDKLAAGAGWPKASNWRAAAEMSQADLDNTDLGEFLENL